MAKENKETFTYSTLPSVRAKAKKKAEKEGWSLSEKIDQLLREYVDPKNQYTLVTPEEAQRLCKRL